VSSGALAAITTNEGGGGVAAASRLMWRAVRERWPAESRLVTLVPECPATATLESSIAARMRFGARLAKLQMLGQARWVFYTHVAIAQVQTFLPQAVRRPYGVFLHGIEAWCPLPGARRRAVEGAALLVANSVYTAMRVREANPWIPAIAVCPLAWDETTGAVESPIVHPAPVPDIGAHAVLLVARMMASERYKGHDELLQSWPGVVASVPDARLVFVGSGDDAPRLKEKARALGVSDRVVFTGFVTAALRTELYRRAAVFAMPSRGEGFGVVYLEAMARALPCIGSIHDAAREVIEDGVTGFLVNQTDAGALKDRLVRLLTDTEARTEMGARGHRRLEQRFSYDAFRGRFADLLARAFEAPAGATSPADSFHQARN